MGFSGLSRQSLQDAVLHRLSRLANLRKESKQHRARLGEVRSEIALLHHELKEIEEQLERIVAIPQTVAAPARAEQPGKVVKIRKTE